MDNRSLKAMPQQGRKSLLGFPTGRDGTESLPVRDRKKVTQKKYQRGFNMMNVEQTGKCVVTAK